MDNLIVYRPYRFHYYCAFLSLCIGAFASVIMGCYLPTVDWFIIVWFAVLFLSVFFAKVLYDSSNITMLFEEEGLRIVGGKYADYSYFPWNMFTIAYYARSYKGHLFLVLSPEPLTQTQAKQYVNRSANLSKLQIKSAIVIHLDATQDVSKVKEIVNTKLSRQVDISKTGDDSLS